MHIYISEIIKKQLFYEKKLEDDFIFKEEGDIKYLIAIISETNEKIKCLFVIKGKNENIDYLIDSKVKHRIIFSEKMKENGIYIQNLKMKRVSHENLPKLLLYASLYCFRDKFPEIKDEKEIKDKDIFSYLNNGFDNPLLKIYEREFCIKDEESDEDNLLKLELRGDFIIDCKSWGNLSLDYCNFKKSIINAENKKMPYDLIFIMKDIDKYKDYIIKDLYSKLVKPSHSPFDVPTRINFKNLFKEKNIYDIDDEKKDEKLVFDDVLTVIRMPFDYYRVYEHADQYSKEPTLFRDIDMTLFSKSKEIKKRVDEVINEVKNELRKSVIVFLCDNEVEYDKIGLFHNELKEHSFKVINFNEISTKHIKEYYYCKLNLMEIENVCLDDLVNDYYKNNDNALLTVNVRNLDAYFDKWYNEYLFKKAIIDKTTYMTKKEKNKNGKELLNGMVGEIKVKEQLEKICANFEVQKIREFQGCKKASTNKHMFFTGNPGTGKTEMARIIAKMLYEKGIINNDKIVEVGVDELTSQWVGDTENVCKARIEEAFGGILFIDEAYSLMNERIGKNAIDVLVKEMENNRDRLIVIMAGYKKQMEMLMNLNSGLKSRIAKEVEFDDFTMEELIQIAKRIAKNQDYFLNENALKVLKNILQNEKNNNNFGNGRTVRNIMETAIENQSFRIRPLLKNILKEKSNEYSKKFAMKLLKELKEEDFIYKCDEKENKTIGFCG